MYNILSLVHKTVPVKHVNVVLCPIHVCKCGFVSKNATITRLHHHDYMRASSRVFQVINELYRILNHMYTSNDSNHLRKQISTANNWLPTDKLIKH